MGLLMGKIRPFSMELLPFLPLKNGFWPVILLLFMISEWNFTDMLNSKGYILGQKKKMCAYYLMKIWNRVGRSILFFFYFYFFFNLK